MATATLQAATPGIRVTAHGGRTQQDLRPECGGGEIKTFVEELHIVA